MTGPAEEGGGPAPTPRPEPESSQEGRLSPLARGTALALGALALLLLWQLADFVLVAFGAVLVAVLLDALAEPVERRLHLPQALAVGLVVALLLGALAAFATFGGPQVATQIAQLAERLPGAASELQTWLEGSPWGEVVIRRVPPPEELARSAASLLGRVPGLFSTAAGALTNLGFMLLIGLYVAINPGRYRRGLLHLVPIPQREQADALLEALGHALRWWLVGRLAAMAVVGVLTAVGLWLIEMPLVLALALIAGLFSFVPFLGPIASAVPALLIAFGQGWVEAVWVVAVYSGVQFLEGNFITPIIQLRAVSLPPAVLLASQLLLGLLLGLVGVLLATPLAVALIVTVQVLYVRRLLGDRVPILGEHGRVRAGEGTRPEPGAKPAAESRGARTRVRR